MDTVRKRGEIISFEQRSLVSQRYRRITRAVNSEFWGSSSEMCIRDSYLCEKFGYRESCSVMSHANGFCVDIRERDLDCYIRFWEYSCGRGNFPDWSIIIAVSYTHLNTM